MRSHVLSLLALLVAYCTTCSVAANQPSHTDVKKAYTIHTKALTYLQADRLNEGIALLLKALQYDKRNSLIYANLGLAYQKSSKPRKAWQAYSKSYQLDKSNGQVWTGLAWAYAECGDKARALKLLEEAKKRFTHDKTVQMQVNSLESKYADGKTAILGSTNLVRAHPEDFNTWRLLVASYCQQKKYKEAYNVLGRAKSRFANKSEYHALSGYCLMKSGMDKEAAAEFLTASKLDPTDPLLLSSAMHCQTSCGDLDGLQATRKLFVRRFPDSDHTNSVKDAISYYERDFANIRKQETEKHASGMKRPFSVADMPLKVFVHDRLKGRTVWTAGKSKSKLINYSLLIERAMQDWSNASRKKISFVFTNNLDDANIECRWTTDRAKLHYSFAAGVTSYQRNKRGQAMARVNLLASTAENTISAAEFYETCLHELGHALGLTHSSHPSDIMYFSGSAKTAMTKKARTLSNNDIERLRSLYKYM